jgi:hypothetical protein
VDILDLDGSLALNPEAQRDFEDLVVQAVEEALDRCWEARERATAQLEQVVEAELELHGPGVVLDERGAQNDWEPDDYIQVNPRISYQIDEHITALNDRRDLLRLLAALVGQGSDPLDHAFDCSAIDEVITVRRKRLADRYSVTDHRISSPLKPQQRPGTLAARRGPKPRQRWQDFAAEMVRWTHMEPIPLQAALERHMAQWCLENWHTEPSPSYLREWVAPTFQAYDKCRALRKPCT